MPDVRSPRGRDRRTGKIRHHPCAWMGWGLETSSPRYRPVASHDAGPRHFEAGKSSNPPATAEWLTKGGTKDLRGLYKGRVHTVNGDFRALYTVASRLHLSRKRPGANKLRIIPRHIVISGFEIVASRVAGPLLWKQRHQIAGNARTRADGSPLKLRRESSGKIPTRAESKMGRLRCTRVDFDQMHLAARVFHVVEAMQAGKFEALSEALGGFVHLRAIDAPKDAGRSAVALRDNSFEMDRCENLSPPAGEGGCRRGARHEFLQADGFAARMKGRQHMMAIPVANGTDNTAQARWRSGEFGEGA